MTIRWVASKYKSLFSLKDKNPCPACQIYKETCVCLKTHIGKTIRNVDIGWHEHEDTHKKSELEKHLRENLNGKFKLETLLQLLKTASRKKILKLLL